MLDESICVVDNNMINTVVCRFGDSGGWLLHSTLISLLLLIVGDLRQDPGTFCFLGLYG